MAVRRTKVKDGENLTDSNKEKVISLLEQDKPITKKAACEILNIAYNTTRLKSILEEYVSDKKFKKEMRAKMRNLPVDISTCGIIVSSYLSGSSLLDISDDTYRSTNVVKNILTRYNVPIRNTSVDYFNPVYIESDVQDYKKGDLIYSARYDKPATIDTISDSKIYGKVFGIWLHGENRMHAYQPYYEIADLRKVQTELNIKMYDMPKEDIIPIMNEAMRKMKKQEDKRG